MSGNGEDEPRSQMPRVTAPLQAKGPLQQCREALFSGLILNGHYFRDSICLLSESIVRVGILEMGIRPRRHLPKFWGNEA